MTEDSGTTPRTRSSVDELRSRPVADVLIIGGGINGLSTFRDLALQGVDVALVERGDYLGGASSASSHMIHGGIRYLENGEFRLVNESVHERNRLLRNAPHYVRPLITTIPIYSTFSGLLAAPLRLLTHRQRRPKERGALLIKLGLVIYDSFSRDGGTVPRHRFRGRRRSLAELPALNPDLKYTATYYDASVHEPERLGLDVLADALATGTARSANYLEAVGVTEAGILLRDAETGEQFPFLPRVVVNASGPWTDLTNTAMGAPTALLGGTKGSHIVVDNPELLAACDDREIFFENGDGRIVLVEPLKGRVMIGTSDLDADPREPAVCTDAEVDYFIELVSHVFPAIAVTREQIVYRFAGIRPLPRHEDTQPGFVSRDYRVVRGALPAMPEVPVLSLVGGKWTTFRALGERVADEVLDLLDRPRTVSTESLAIGGGRDYPRGADARARWVDAQSSGLRADRVSALFDRYGTRASEVIAAIGGVDSPLVSDPTFSRAEVAHLARTESVVHLTDLIFRRTNHAFTGDVSIALLTELAGIIGDTFGWDAARRAAEVRATARELAALHGIQLAGEF